MTSVSDIFATVPEHIHRKRLRAAARMQRRADLQVSTEAAAVAALGRALDNRKDRSAAGRLVLRAIMRGEVPGVEWKGV